MHSSHYLRPYIGNWEHANNQDFLFFKDLFVRISGPAIALISTVNEQLTDGRSQRETRGLVKKTWQWNSLGYPGNCLRL